LCHSRKKKDPGQLVVLPNQRRGTILGEKGGRGKMTEIEKKKKTKDTHKKPQGRGGRRSPKQSNSMADVGK